MKTGSDEIDLMELLTKGYRGIKNNLTLFIILPLGCAVIALLLFAITEDEYASSMMVATDLITLNESQFISKEIESQNAIPGLTDDEAARLKSISFQIESGEAILEKRINIFYTITVEVTDPALFPVLEKKLLAYLDSLQPIVQNRERERLLNQQMILKIDEEIALMDEIKKQSNSKAIINSIDPSNLFARAVDLFKERTQRELRLKEIESVRLTKGFASYIRDAKLNIVFVALIGFTGGFLVFVVIMFIMFFNRYNRSFQET